MPRTRKQTASPKKVKIVSSKSTARKVNHILGVLIIILGLLFFIFPSVYKNLSALKLSTLVNQSRTLIKLPNAKKTDSKNTGPFKIDSKLLSEHEQSQPPQRIVVPTLNVDLPIVEAKVVAGYWELSDTSASHGVGSANPGELGNEVIFAHARDDLFGPLRNIKPGTIIYILTKDHWYTYRVTDTKLVDPTDVQVIAPTADQTLTLYTCDGFLDSKRLIVTAKPQ